MELLEDLRIQTDCAFVSDLRECTKFHSIKNALNNLDVQSGMMRRHILPEKPSPFQRSRRHQNILKISKRRTGSDEK